MFRTSAAVSFLCLFALACVKKPGAAVNGAGAPCADGTGYLQCSKSKPLFCDSDGTLVDDRLSCDSSAKTGFLPSLSGPQTIYKTGAPHFDRSGYPRKLFSSSSSYFPIWMYGMKHPRTAYLCHPDESAKKWRSAVDPRVSNVALLKQGAFNTAQYWGESDAAEDFLEEVSRLNMKALMYWKPLNDGLAGAPLIRDFIARNAYHPNILAWIPTEETGHYLSQYLTPARPTMDDWISLFDQTRSEIRALSPRAVFNIENLWVANQTEDTADSGLLAKWRSWNDAGDVIALDVYPRNLKSINTFDTVGGLPRAGQFVTNVYGQSKPLWVMLNAFEQEPDSGQPKTAEFPSPQQMRAMAYISIVHGATGIGYFIGDDYASRKAKIVGIRPDTPTRYLRQGECSGPEWSDMLEISEDKAAESRALWSSVAQTNLELQSLAPVLLYETSYYYYRIDVSGPTHSQAPIRAMLKEYDGYFYLIAVNLDRAKLYASFNIEIAAAPERVEALFESRWLRSAPAPAGAIIGKFVDHFDEFGVHVYRWPKR